jgi:hypothetical protein
MSSSPERFRTLLKGSGFGYSNIRKDSIVQFQQRIALSASLSVPN